MTALARDSWCGFLRRRRPSATDQAGTASVQGVHSVNLTSDHHSVCIDLYFHQLTRFLYHQYLLSS